MLGLLKKRAKAKVMVFPKERIPIMEQYILDNYDNLLPPVVGTMTYLKGTPGTTNGDEAECVKFYFNNNFRVREGYSYNLRFPFVEEMKPGSVAESCEGYSEVLLKIVPDYEVWTGEAGNKDWSNDENWRRADFDELYGGNGILLSANEEDDNYYFYGSVSQYTLEVMTLMEKADEFPADVDEDGNGIVYEIINGDDAPFYADDAIYQEWRSGVFGDNAPIDLPWHNVDELVHPNE